MSSTMIPVVVENTPFSVEDMDTVTAHLSNLIMHEYAQKPLDAYVLLGSLTKISLAILRDIKDPCPSERMLALMKLLEDSNKTMSVAMMH